MNKLLLDQINSVTKVPTYSILTLNKIHILKESVPLRRAWPFFYVRVVIRTSFYLYSLGIKNDLQKKNLIFYVRKKKLKDPTVILNI